MSGKSIRDRYVQPTDDDAVIEEHEEEDDSDIYKALGLGSKGGGRRIESIMIYYEDGVTREVLAYNYIIRMFATDASHVSIFSTEGVFLIEGQNLYEMLDKFHARKLGAIRAFNPDLYPEPPAANAPIILSIDYLTNRDWQMYLQNRDEVRPPE